MFYDLSSNWLDQCHGQLPWNVYKPDINKKKVIKFQ